MAAFLISQGETVKPCGSEMLWERGGRVTIRDNIFFSQYEQKGGNAIDFVRKYYNLSYQDAVQMLIDERIEPISYEKKQKEKGKKEFTLPNQNSSMKQIYAYLLRSRYLNKNVIDYFVKNELLYESDEIFIDKETKKEKHIHNCIFVGKDEKGVPRHAHKRGTYTLGESGYKGNIDNCDSKYSFHHIGTSDTIYAFEAPIDMLSFISLYQNEWQKNSYVSLCSVAEHALIHILNNNPHITKICLCLDNDIAGIDSEYRIRLHLKELGYTDISFIRPKYKDWNEILKAKNGIEPIPAEPHRALQKMYDLIKQTVPFSVQNAPLSNPYKSIVNDYNAVAKAKTLPEMSDRANKLATDTICMIQTLKETDTKAIVRGLKDIYLPHKDNKNIRFESKLKELKASMYSVARIFGTDQTRLENTLDEDLKALYQLASEALRIQSHIDRQLAIEQSIIQESEVDNAWEIQQA